MRYVLMGAIVLVCAVPGTQAYIEVPHTLGRCVQESTTIVVMEVEKVSQEKGLIIFKKLLDLKGKHPQQQIKHNIGKRGFHPREWQNVMAWAEPGKKAIFFHNGGSSETCIGTYWYQCYPEGEWWGMSHAEPFLLRTFYGETDKLQTAVTEMLQGKEVVVSCLADGSKDQLHQRKGKLQSMKASLKLMDYNPRRDFVGFGAEGVDIQEFKTIVLLPESSAGWKYLPAKSVANLGNRWQATDFDDAAWRKGKSPIGYGEEEISKRTGTIIEDKGEPFVFRREFDVPAELLTKKDLILRISVASDDNARVFLNGLLVDDDPEVDHEFMYWNRDVELPAKHFKAGRNVLAVYVKNGPKSSDLYLDMEVTGLIPIPRKVVAKVGPEKTPVTPRVDPAKQVLPQDKFPAELVVDKTAGSITLPCTIAPRKLPHLKEIYPLEVMATYPKGQKAHETVVNFEGIKPSMVHRALIDLGVKPGKGAVGEGARATGPELKVFLEFLGKGDKVQRLPIEKVLVDEKKGQALPALQWHFTGSAFRQPDPEKEDYVYGADLSGTLITLFPVTEDAVIQSSWTLPGEGSLRLEVLPGLLPKEGTAAKLIVQVVR